MNSFFGDRGAFRLGEHPGRIHLVRWLSETPLYRDSFEIVAEKARHFWWAQQVNLGLVSWSMYLTLEGQRRQVCSNEASPTDVRFANNRLTERRSPTSGPS